MTPPPPEQPEDLAALIERLLGDRRMTQKELAERSGIPYSTLNSWVKRRRGSGGQIDPEKLRALAAAFDVSPRRFFQVEGLPAPGPLSEEREAKLLRIYRSLSVDSQRALIQTAEAMMKASRAS